VHSAVLIGQGVFGIGPDDLVLSVSKLHFAFGLGNALYFPASVGAASILVPERPEPSRVFELIHAERPTMLFTVPTMYARLLHVDSAEHRYDLSSLRVCVSSGEALPATLFHAWRSRFGLSCSTSWARRRRCHDFIANRPGRARPGSSGEIVPGWEARLVDDDGRTVAPGAVGHLLVKGESTAPCYWNRHETTKATMLGEWLRPGDMFRQDGDGYFYFCGRSDDMLRVAGQWVAPAEVEACPHGASCDPRGGSRRERGRRRPHEATSGVRAEGWRRLR
jgi:benzoate-CoA ligase